MVICVKEKQKSNRPKQHSQKSSKKCQSRESLRLQESKDGEGQNDVLVVENDVEKRTVDLQPPAVIVNEAQCPEPVHEKADPRAGCAYHLSESLLADFGDYSLRHAFLGKPREIVSPGIIQVVIQKHRWKQAELEGEARSELLEDLPRAEVLFVGVGANQIEVDLIGEGLGEEVSPAGERFQVKELVFDEAMNGFDIALEGVSGGRNTGVLAVAQSGGETGRVTPTIVTANELTTVIGLPDEVPQRDAAAVEMLLHAGGKQGAGGGGAALSEGPEE
jgi:hypothetical protein